MVTVDLKGVHRVISKGRVYYYAWRGGPRLVGAPGSPEFLKSYQDARNPLANLDRGQFSTWVKLYRDSKSFRDSSPITRKKWAPWLDRIEDRFGKMSVRHFDNPEFRRDIKKWLATWEDKARTADYGKQVLSAVLSFIVGEGKLRENICFGISNLYSVDRSEIIWEERQIRQFLDHPDIAIELKWALRLARLTGFRKSDLLRVSWGHVGPHSIDIRTQKSSGKKSRRKRTASAPTTQELRELLAEIPRRATTILTSSKKRSWTADGFGSSWWKAMEDCGLHAGGIDLHLHDLRGTFATDIYRAGFSVREIAETLGWAEDQVERLISRYVKRDEIMKERVRRLEEQTGTNVERTSNGSVKPV